MSTERPTYNKPIAYMAADVITQTSALRRNCNDYPQCNELETPRMQVPKRYSPVKN